MRDDTEASQKDRALPGYSLRDKSGQRTATLRVLATTDIHMQLLGHDDITDRTLTHHGLAGLATMITQARREAAAAGYAQLLLDNGDLLQGSALGDALASKPVRANHPVIAAFNHLQYDAVGLGNHDLDYGLEYLRDVARALSMPVISSNLSLADPGTIERSALIHCTLPGTQDDALAVGLISVLPENTAVWNCHRLGPKDAVLPSIASIRAEVSNLRKKGAQVIVLMAHMGIRGDALDDAVHLAELPGIDALITGHTHRRFPGDDHAMRPGVDPGAGLLWGRPAVMPGHAASDLAVLDLGLRHDPDTGWQLDGHRVELRQNTIVHDPDKTIQRLGAAEHRKMRHKLQTVVGQTDHPLHNYFSLARPTETCALLARAQARVVKDAIADKWEAELPLIAAVPAHTAGGRAGPQHYLHIPPGPLLRRHLMGLAPYADQIWALRINGTGVRHWLERAAAVFNRLYFGHRDQMLINDAEPAFHFDTLYGLTYRIDPSKPLGQRISHLRCQGRPVLPDQTFVMVTNQFRAGGGGGYGGHPIVHRSDVAIEDALIAELQAGDGLFSRWDTPWHFDCPCRVEAVLNTSPDALGMIDDIAHLSPSNIRRTGKGFAAMRLTLAPLRTLTYMNG